MCGSAASAHLYTWRVHIGAHTNLITLPSFTTFPGNASAPPPTVVQLQDDPRVHGVEDWGRAALQVG